NGVSVEATVRNLGTLRLVETPVRLMTTHGPLGVRLTAGWIGLDADPTKLELRDADSEMSFEVVAERGWPQSTSMFLIGANLRQDKSLFPIAISHEHRFQEGVRGNASLAFNELSEESAAFRAEGKRDRFTLGLFGEPTRREYFAATLNGLRYLTRAGASLGKGIKLDLELGHRLWMRHPEWRLSVYGTSTWNDLRQNLPQDLAMMLPANAGMGAVLPDRYRELGFTTTLQKGPIKPLGYTGSAFHYVLGTGLFWRTPPSGIGYRLEAGIGGRLFGADDLSLSGFFSGSQGGVETEPSMGIGLRYSLRLR
ncbi:MAG: hypothetical protein WAN46_15715, partial [Gammaproteobacteria bacterium]